MNAQVEMMSRTTKRTWVEIDLDAIVHNYQLVKKRVAPGCRVLAVIKADAYGHGAVEVAQALAQDGADYFAVSSIEEALELRQAKIGTPLLILGYTDAEMAPLLARRQITQTVTGLEHAGALNRAAKKAGVRLRVHIKVDTGMARLGLDCRSEAQIRRSAAEIRAIMALENLYVEGIFTHFAVADTPSSDFTKAQFAHFKQLLALLEKEQIYIPIRHCCNSAAILRESEMHLDMVRMGIILYGLSPDHDGMDDFLTGFYPALSVRSVVAQVKRLEPGDTVSYGRIFTADRPMRIATVPIGYADGYIRRLSNRARMLLHGKPAPQIGRICMDQCMIDISEIDGVRPGDIVTIVGRDGGEEVPVGELAGLLETIDYEFVCSLSRRMPRIYYRNQKESGYVCALTGRPGK